MMSIPIPRIMSKVRYYWKTGSVRPHLLVSQTQSPASEVPRATALEDMVRIGVNGPRGVRPSDDFWTLDIELRTNVASFIIFHQTEHVFDGTVHAHKQRTADDAMTDIQFNQMRHAVQHWNIFIIQTMTRVYFQPQVMSLLSAGN